MYQNTFKKMVSLLVIPYLALAANQPFSSSLLRTEDETLFALRGSSHPPSSRALWEASNGGGSWYTVSKEQGQTPKNVIDQGSKIISK